MTDADSTRRISAMALASSQSRSRGRRTLLLSKDKPMPIIGGSLFWLVIHDRNLIAVAHGPDEVRQLHLRDVTFLQDAGPHLLKQHLAPCKQSQHIRSRATESLRVERFVSGIRCRVHGVERELPGLSFLRPPRGVAANRCGLLADHFALDVSEELDDRGVTSTNHETEFCALDGRVREIPSRGWWTSPRDHRA